MRKDIDFSPVKDVHVVIAKTEEGWRAFLLNRNRKKLDHVMITSRGYGETKTENFNPAPHDSIPGCRRIRTD